MKTRFLILVMTALLMQSCVWKQSQKEKIEQVNNSALYDPPSVTLIKNKEYQFEEGVISGRGQIYHSNYSYIRALIIGK